MKRLLKWVGVILIVLLLIMVGSYFYVINSNNFQVDGNIKLASLEKPVKVYRDAKGMAYIHAESFPDLIRAQGYITAQDRLFQMQLTRMFAEGRLSEFAGEKALKTDIKMRTLGFTRLASTHAKILDEESKAFLQYYAEGVNEFIKAKKDIPLEFSLAGFEPDTWTIESSLAIMYYMGWGSSANLKTEIIAHKIINKIGLEKFKEIYPMSSNPDDPNTKVDSLAFWQDIESDTSKVTNNQLETTLSFIEDKDFQIKLGSNNWVVDASRSVSNKPMLASDPHLDSRMLPGVMHNLGLFSGDIRIVGVTVPGIPGILIGRSKYLTNGITNAYLDCQDLFIEQLDAENDANYLEGNQSIPFEIIEEQIKVKDKEAEGGFRIETVSIRKSKRGVVISDIFPNLDAKQVIALRWSPAETMGKKLGLDFLFKSKNVQDAKKYLSQITITINNFCVADASGNIAWFTTGRLPKRRAGVGRIPYLVQDNAETWTGWIPYKEMPQQIASKNGWLGNANHNTVPADYPYYISNYFAANYRYARLRELMKSKKKFTVEDHWQFQRDDYNVAARILLPMFIKALKAQDETKSMAELLEKWDYRQDTESVGATIFQNMYRILPRLIYEDELGEELSLEMLDSWYFWQERTEKMLLANDSKWFDDNRTKDKVETRDDLIQSTGLLAKKELTQLYGSDMKQWKWGKNHKMTYINPIRREGWGKEWLGTAPIPMGGSGETLYRALYDYNNSQDIAFSACMRMVADLGDEEKVLAVINGGTTARTFHQHHKDQIEQYMSGEKQYWWFSDEKIKANAEHTLILKP